MNSNIGIDNKVLVRDAINATGRALAFSSSVASTIPKIFFWFGQISTHYVEQHDGAQPRPDADCLAGSFEKDRVGKAQLWASTHEVERPGDPGDHRRPAEP